MKSIVCPNCKQTIEFAESVEHVNATTNCPACGSLLLIEDNKVYDFNVLMRETYRRNAYQLAELKHIHALSVEL